MAALTGTTEPVRYLDVCSGYSAFTVAKRGLGFDCAGYAEIDAFPSAMLGAHYGATRARYMPDPDAGGIGLKERLSRLKLCKSMAALNDSHFGNQVVNFGDFTHIRADDVGPIDLLIGGTPCQAFSVAGQRLGLDDPRGNLTLEFLALAKRVRASWLAWENVPGFLSHDKGRTLGTFLGLLGQLGYGWAYRVLDAQYIRVDRFARAVPQRRKRVILVAHLGDAAGPAAVLFERESLRGDSAPRRETGEGVARPLGAGSPSNSGYRNDADTAENLLVGFGGGNTTGPISVGACLTAKGQRVDFEVETFIAHSLRAQHNLSHRADQDTLIVRPAAASLTRGADGGRRQEDDFNLVAHSLRADASEDGTGRGTPIVPVAYSIMPQNSGRDYKAREVDVAQPLMAGGPVGGNQGGDFVAQPIAFAQNSRSEVRLFGDDGQTVGALGADAGVQQQCYVADRWAVRRLTPTECERLMGVPDDFTAITYRGKPAADGPRYKALGNSQAANMMRWVAHGLADVIAAQRACGMDVAA